LIEESEVLRKLVRDPRSRDSGKRFCRRIFRGVLVMTGANSARPASGRWRRDTLFLDEVDAYQVMWRARRPDHAGVARTRTFARRKVLLDRHRRSPGNEPIRVRR